MPDPIENSGRRSNSGELNAVQRQQQNRRFSARKLVSAQPSDGA